MKTTGMNQKKFKKQVSRKESSRRITAVLLAAALVVTSVWAGAPRSQREAYASSDWASSYLQNLVEQGVLKGDPDGTLNPERDITRAEFAAMLNRAFGFQEKGTVKNFSDVAADAWYRNDIAIASNQGYLSGTSPSTANPTGSLTREQAVTMICRALKIDEVTADPLRFSDSEDFQNWSRGYINAATQKGMVNGYSDGTFRASAPITRGEVAKMLSDVAGTIVKTPSQVNLGYVNGNVSLTRSGAGLRNTTISGDLYITEGVGLGYVYLDNVTVLGNVIISGAGQSNKGDSSIVADGCNFKNVVVNVGKDKTLSLVAKGDTVIDNTVVKSTAYLEENNVRKSAFNDVQLKGPDNTRLDLSGTFKEVRVMAPKNQLVLGKGNIQQLTVDEYGPGSSVFLEKNTSVEELYADVGTKVTGSGSISSVNIAANGTTVTQLPDEIIIRPGISATVNGQQMGSVDADQSNESPKVRSGYPDVTDITPNSAQGKVMVNKPGQLYWMVRNGDDGSPSQDEMKNPAGAKNVISSGKVQVQDADKEIKNQLSSLKPGEGYELFVMLEDSKGTLSRVRSDSFQTIDNTKPQFIQSYPKAEAIYSTVVVGEKDPMHMIKVSFVSNKDVGSYWVLMKKGDPAPTAEMVAAQNVSNTVLKGVNNGTKKNTLFDFLIFDDQKDSASRLEENTSYDVYVCLKDSSGNLSNLSKLSVTTKDVTPPDFQPGYPKTGAILPTSVSIEYETTKSCKLYWMVCEKDAPFPPGLTVSDPTTTEGGILNTDAAKQAVITGNGAYKGLKGTQTTTMNQYGSFTVNSLENQKLYDLYMVLQDQAGNLSKVTKLQITTQDDIPPSAEMLFDGMGEGGQPSVGSPLQIQFSEPVYGVSRNVTGQITSKAAFAAGVTIPQEQMEHYVRLYDMSASTPTPVAITFSNVSFLSNNGKTVMVFPTADAAAGDATSKAAIKLKSGNSYEFRLKEIADSSLNMLLLDNKIDYGWDGGKNYKALKGFTTQAPFIELRETTIPTEIPEPDKPIDLGFEIEPKILNAGDTLCYDSVLECNQDITFDLYEKTKEGNGLKPLNTKDDGKGGHIPLSMMKGHYYLIRERLHQGEQDYLWQDSKFNDLGLDKKQYYIHLRTVGSSEDRTSWNGEINMIVRGIAGEPKDMRALSFKGINGGKFDSDIIFPGINAKQVSNPTSIVIPVYFIDNKAPVFLDKPTLTPADVLLNVDVQLDKQGKVSWLLAPEHTVTQTPSAIQLDNHSIKPDGAHTGDIDVPSGHVVTRLKEPIKNLVPDAVYNFYYTAKGVNAFSPVDMERVTMSAIQKPLLRKDFFNYTAVDEDTVNMTTHVDNASAQIAWAVYPKNTYPDDKMPSITEITSAASNPGSGAGVISAGKVEAIMGQPITFPVKNLKSKTQTRYDFYAIAINSILANQEVSDSNWTDVIKIPNIAPLDNTPPVVTLSDTSAYVATSPAGVRPPFNGTLEVNFSKPLYYVVTDGVYAPLTTDLIEDWDNPTKKPLLEIFGGGKITKAVAKPRMVGDKDLVVGFTLEFENVHEGTVIDFPREIASINAPAGYIFRFKFKVNGGSPSFSGSTFTPVVPDPGKR